jgi:hypothetical protein
VHNIDFIFETVNYLPDRIKKVRAKINNRGVKPQDQVPTEENSVYSHGDTEVWNSMDTASEMDEEHLGLDIDGLSVVKSDVVIEMQVTGGKGRKDSLDVEAGNLGGDVIVIGETAEYDIMGDGVEVEVEVEMEPVEFELGAPEVEVEVEVEADVEVEVEADVEVEVEADVEVEVEDGQE